MADPNPQRKTARVVAFACYILAAVVLFAGTFFTLAAATVELSGPGLEHITNGRMAVLMASLFIIIALMLVLIGRRIQLLLGQQYRQDKLVTRSTVGCLRLGSLGCGMWAFLSALMILLTGIFPTGDPAGPKEIFMGSSGSILAIIFMLSVARFLSKNFVSPKPEGGRAYQAYVARVQPKLPGLADPATRAYVQEQTFGIIKKLDGTSKGILMEYLGSSGLLNGNTRINLQDADFRGVDLHAINLPRADLHGINLEQAKLQDAILFEANLSRVRLNGADLSRANLQWADLRHADLTDALLDGANLSGADLTGAIYTASQLGRARTSLPSGA